MALLNTCTPNNVYGPLNQTLFLGLTVKDFSATVGWNEQFTTLTINLLTDSCSGSRDYMDDNYNWVIGENFANGDPGFNNPEVGSSAIFKIGEVRDSNGDITYKGFEFAGLIQSYNLQDDAQGRNILTVNMISPGVVLEGTQVIVDGYADSTEGIRNIINVYGFLESLGQFEGFACPDLGGFGSPNGGYGFSRKTDRGLPWDLLKKGVQVLLGGRYNGGAHLFAELPGVMTFRPGLASEKYGSITSDKYIVDIEDIPAANDINYRINGPTISMLELISQTCGDAGCDYYVDLLPTKDAGTAGPLVNVIKIRVVSRVAQASNAALQDINNFIQGKDGFVTQQSLGEEMRAETTAGFIIGGQKEQLYEAFANSNPDFSNIIPYFGPSVTQITWGANEYADAQWYIDIDYSNLQLETAFTVPATQLDTETMLCAALGDFQSFWTWIFTYGQGTQPWYYATVVLGMSPSAFFNNVERGTSNKQPNTGKVIGMPAELRTASFFRDLNRVYDFIHTISEEYYGKAFLVNVPFVCAYRDTDTNKLVFSDLPAQDGWREPAGTSDVIGGSVSNGELMGLTVGTAATDFFASENGKLQSFLRWNFAFQNFDNNVASTQDGFITIPNDSVAASFYMKATVNDQWYYFSRAFGNISVINMHDTEYAPGRLVAALLTTSTRVTLFNQTIDQKFIMHLGSNFRTGTLPANMAAGLANAMSSSDDVNAGSTPYAFPFGAVFPVRSETRTYGPWYKAAPNAVGKVFTEKDDGFVPWEYGGAKYMTQGAALKLSNKVTDMEKGERGSVTVAGYPEKQLGTALSESPIHLDDRSLSVYFANPYSYFFLDVGGLSTKISQITNINVTVNPSSLTTQYQLSSFTPQFGRFTRGNEERLKQLAQQRFQTNKRFRAGLAQGPIVNNVAQRIFRNYANSINNTNFAHRSSPLFLAGKFFSIDGDGVSRKQVANLTDGDLFAFGDFNNSAAMTLDGMFRPVQNRHSSVTGLPVENAPGTPSYNYQRTFSESPAGPLDNYTGVIVNTDYMRFLTNPNGSSADAEIFSLQGSGSALGHDIEMVARSNTGVFNSSSDSGYLGIQDNNAINYTNDYRYMTMRGPLVIQGWGYDLMGKPIPNSGESTPYYPPGGGSPTSGSVHSGNHRTDYHMLSDQFYPDWLGKPETWPTAPVDLRYDRRRGVWTVPNDFRLYIANLRESISGVGDTTLADVHNVDDVYDSTGSPMSGTAEITVTMPLPDVAIDAEPILVYYSHESGQWWPISYCCSSTGTTGDPPTTDPPRPPCTECENNECLWECVGGTFVQIGDVGCNQSDTAPDDICNCKPPGNCTNCDPVRFPPGTQVVGACIRKSCDDIPPQPCDTNNGGGGADSCLIGDTLIKTPSGLKHISSLIIGDEINTHQGIGNVIDIHESIVNEVYTILFEDDSSIISSASHPFALMGKTIDLSDESQYMRAKNLKIGDIILGEVSNKIIKDIKLDKKDTKVYNLTVSNGHSYISNGIYSHNKYYVPYSFSEAQYALNPTGAFDILTHSTKNGSAGFTETVRATLSQDFTNYETTGNGIFLAKTLSGESVKYSGAMTGIIVGSNSDPDETDCILTPGSSNSGFPLCPPFAGSGSDNFRNASIMNQGILDHIPSGSYVTLQFNYKYLLYEIVEWKPTGVCVEVDGTDSYALFYPYINANASSNDVVIRLPISTGIGIPGKEFTVKKIDASINTVTVSGSGGNLIDGQSSYTLNNQYETAKFVACGDNWFVY